MEGARCEAVSPGAGMSLLTLLGKSSSKSTPMTKEAASRIQSASDKNLNSKSDQSGFAGHAQSTSDKRSSKEGYFQRS
jgi:hypothetical protein